MVEVEVIEDASAAVAALEPLRSRLLAELGAPASAAGLAARLDIPRQKINYHLRTLEAHGLVEVAEQRRWGGLTERLYVATASSYVVSPRALGNAAADPSRTRDRLSASFVVALAARVVREVGALWRAARTQEKRLATLGIEAEIRFASAAARAAFTQDLTNAITEVIARHHDASTPGGRAYRLVVVAHPIPRERG